VRLRLAEREIAAEYGQARGAECIRERDKERRVAVRSRAVRQYEAIRTGSRRAVQEPSKGHCSRRVRKFSIVIHIEIIAAERRLFNFPESAQRLKAAHQVFLRSLVVEQRNEAKALPLPS